MAFTQGSPLLTYQKMVRYTVVVQKNREERGGVDHGQIVDTTGPILCKTKENFYGKGQRNIEAIK